MYFYIISNNNIIDEMSFYNKDQKTTQHALITLCCRQKNEKNTSKRADNCFVIA